MSKARELLDPSTCPHRTLDVRDDANPCCHQCGTPWSFLHAMREQRIVNHADGQQCAGCGTDEYPHGDRDPAPQAADSSYAAFLDRKAQLANGGGFEPVDLPSHLFDYQRELVEWAARQGRGALFADCGLGKTPMSLAWAEQVYRNTGRPVLILTPLAVGAQIVTEAGKFGHDAALSRDGSTPAPITVTNYEQLSKFDADQFAGVVCDESSAIKSFDGARRAEVTEFMRLVPYRLLGTATAAPNDYIELGTSSESLGHLGYVDMLGRFFTNKQRSVSSRGRGMGGSALDWRLKGHAEEPFWQWVSSWARAIRRPSDYGYSDVDHVLPELVVREHRIETKTTAESDDLIAVPAKGLREERAENRRTLVERCEAAALALEDANPGVAWCHLNDESALLTRLIDDAVEIAGSEPVEAKEEKLRAFTDGEIRVLVTKPAIGAFGLNWQHAHRATYFPSHSYEQWYQAVRRMLRFGQQHPVEIDVIATEGGSRVLANLQRKAAQADEMFSALIEHMNHAREVDPHTDYTNRMELPSWIA